MTLEEERVAFMRQAAITLLPLTWKEAPATYTNAEVTADTVALAADLWEALQTWEEDLSIGEGGA